MPDEDEMLIECPEYHGNSGSGHTDCHRCDDAGRVPNPAIVAELTRLRESEVRLIRENEQRKSQIETLVDDLAGRIQCIYRHTDENARLTAELTRLREIASGRSNRLLEPAERTQEQHDELIATIQNLQRENAALKAERDRLGEIERLAETVLGHIVRTNDPLLQMAMDDLVAAIDTTTISRQPQHEEPISISMSDTDDFEPLAAESNRLASINVELRIEYARLLDAAERDAGGRWLARNFADRARAEIARLTANNTELMQMIAVAKAWDEEAR